jgi:LmbE family N-acetylglucosaminyl deacetylase
VAARDHLFFTHQLTGGLEKHRPDALLLWMADAPDHVEDISDVVDRKLDALLCHSSQGETTMGDAHTSDDARAEFERRIRERAADQGAMAGVALGEAFKLVRP